MGRIFETRKHTMFARWDKLSKAFTKIGRDISIAVGKGGPNPESNPILRRVIQNARAINMPRDKIEKAIQRASGRDAAGFEEALYEAYAPHGVALLIECATDNPTRTAGNLRSILTKGNGTMAGTGSVSFLFQHMGVFRLNPAGIDAETLELDLIDFGLEEMGESTSDKGEPQLVVRCAFADFGRMQNALEDRKIAPLSATSEYIPTTSVELPEAHATEALRLIDMLEQDDDVQNVFHNLR
ncbi:MAG: YebC/PmpR family DNA-binding transcriptional regulator [Candidatus Hydrogenedentota bacterium]